MTKNNFNFEPKRILKHRNHITINEGQKYDATVQHLEKRNQEFVELKKNEAAKKYGSKKLVRDLNFKSRNGLKIQEPGIGKTPDWFPQLIPVIDWNKTTFLYEIDHLHIAMFFIRELYGEEKTGREQIIQLTSSENGIKPEVVTQLDYNVDKDTDAEDPDGFIEVKISDDKAKNVDVDFKHVCFDEDETNVVNGLREILTSIALKHDHTNEKLRFKLLERQKGGEYRIDLLDKDFVVRFDSSGSLSENVSNWVLELFAWDGCPIDFENIEVNENEK